jgi:hypothetical protein
MSERPDRNDRNVSLEEVGRMLGAYAGPEVARRPSAGSRRIGSAAWLGSAGVAALVVAAIVLALAHVFGGSSRKASLSSPAPCSRLLRFHGVEYVGRALSNPKQLSFRAAVGTGLVPPCGKRQALGVTLVRLAGVEPGVAVGRAGVPEVIYVAARPCLETRVESDLLRCVREAPAP